MKIMSFIMYNHCWEIIVKAYSDKLAELKKRANENQLESTYNLFTCNSVNTVEFKNNNSDYEKLNKSIEKVTKNMQKICMFLTKMKKHRVKNGYECDDKFYNYCDKILNRKVDS